MTNCLFCLIAAGKKGTAFCYEDDRVVAFDDINPKAPIHIVIVPKTHIASAAEMTEDNEAMVGHMVHVAKRLAEEANIDGKGYRLVLNTRAHAGQTVDHIHLHLLGGRPLGSMV